MEPPAIVELVVAKGSDFRDPLYNSGEYGFWTDIVEVPSGSGRFYHVIGVVDVAKGFTNEYRSVLIGTTQWSHGTYWTGFLAHAPYAPAWPIPYP